MPEEILKKVKLLEISTRKLVNELFAGEYHSAFKGQGMVFSEFREYVPGDDIRSISWTLTARTGKPFIKKYDEERELTIILVVDISGSTEFGTGNYFKGEILNHLAAILGFSAIKNGDHVGLLLFSDQIEHYVPPKKGRGHVQRILRDLYYFKPKRRGTQISSAFEYLLGVLKKRSTIFLFSDFLDEEFSASLRWLSRKHEVIAITIEDPAERVLPSLGLVDLEDPETGEIISVDFNSTTFRTKYEENLKKRKELRDKEFRLSQVEKINIISSENFLEPLIAFFKKRH